MSLANGVHYLAIPGPSVMPESVLRAMHRSAPNIYEGELHEVVQTIKPDLKRVARTSAHLAMYIANGHGAWEAALANTVNPGDKVLALTTGRFGHGWAEMAKALGAEVEILDFGRKLPIDLNRVEDVLKADTAHSISSVLAVQVDTASSVRSDIAGLRRVLDAVGHPALLQVDSIACLGCDRMEMDAWGVDVLITGSQKGLMTPPGMGFLFFSDRAEAKRDRMERVSPYWDWRPRSHPNEFYMHFFGTAPTHHLYGLRAALDLIHGEGLEAVWARHAKLARALWAAVEAWGQGGPLQLNVADPAHRSHAVTSLRIGAPHGTALRRWVTEKAGVTLGIGLGMNSPEDPNSDGYFRIGHMGHVNAQMLMGSLGAINAGMVALGIPHGTGGLDAAANVLAEA